MNSTVRYYLGALATRNDLSTQAKELRDILFKDDEPLFLDVKHFMAQQKEINADTISMLNIAVVPGYGAEYFTSKKIGSSSLNKISLSSLAWLERSLLVAKAPK